MSLKKQITILGILAFLFMVPVAVKAAGLVPCGGPTESPCTVKDVFVLAIRVTNTLIGLAGIYAVYQIICAGFWMVVTMGNEESITKHKNTLTQAVVGFVFTMMAYILINTAVNYILLGAEKKECRLDLKDPLNYLIVHGNPTEHANCDKK